MTVKPTVVYLIRHSDYENPKNLFHGRLPGFPLSGKGKKMAERVATYLADKPIVAVYSSRLTRAYETAEIIAKKHHLKVITDKRLLDIKTPLQGKSTAYVDAMDANLYQPKFIAAGGERLEDVYKRTDNFLKEKVLQHNGASIVIVTHGDPIMSTYTIYSGKRLPKWYSNTRWYVPMAGGFKIVFDTVKKLPTISHLPDVSR